MGFKQKALVMAGAICITLGAVTATVVAQSSSDNYMVNEYFFGTGGQRCEPGETGSESYCADMAVGEVTVGSAESDNYMMQAGFNTSDVPLLEVAVNGAVDFGVLSTQSVATGTATMQVRTYLASGYVVRVAGDPPTYSGRPLETPSTPTASAPGTEQFAINLAENTTPAIGATPVQVPDETFSYGMVAANYSTPDLFKYQDQDVVAYSDSSSGQTDYTISMIANMSSATPAGKYMTGLSFVVVATF